MSRKFLGAEGVVNNNAGVDLIRSNKIFCGLL